MNLKQQHRMIQINILIFNRTKFQEVNRPFVLTFNANGNRIGHSRFYLPTEKVDRKL